MDPEEPGDAELLGRAAAGDGAAFTQLMRRHEDRIFAVTLRITGDRNDALDATQDAFISAFRRADAFRGDAMFSTWLFRIAVNSAKDVLRRKSRAPIPQEEEALDISRPSSHRSVDEQVLTRLEVANALAALPDEYREAVTMHDLGGIPYEEIALLVDAPVGTIKSRISRGRKRLAELLEQEGRAGTSKEQL